MKRFEHIKNVKVAAKFSSDKRYRYQLVITKKDLTEGETVCAIMENPSIANEEVADKSVQFLEKLIFEKSYPMFEDVKKLIIVNQYAFIQTNGFAGGKEAVGKSNDSYIKKAIKQSEIILIAWGKSNKHFERQRVIQEIVFSNHKKKIYQTKKHPSRGSYNDFIKKYFLNR